MSNTCGAVVDYPFYLSSNSSLTKLEAEARDLLGKEEFFFLTTECLANYKKLVCSNVYLKCQPGLVLSDTSTYNQRIYSNLGSYRVPFTRPCQKVLKAYSIYDSCDVRFRSNFMTFTHSCAFHQQLCIDVADTCPGVIKTNCSAEFNYLEGKLNVSHFPLQYDTANDAAICNTVPAVHEVASSSEPYLFKQNGACSGIVSNIFISPGSFIVPTFTYLTAPYALQSVIESILVEQFKKIPVQTSSECHFAFRKYFCGSYL